MTVVERGPGARFYGLGPPGGHHIGDSSSAGGPAEHPRRAHLRRLRAVLLRGAAQRCPIDQLAAKRSLQQLQAGVAAEAAQRVFAFVSEGAGEQLGLESAREGRVKSLRTASIPLMSSSAFPEGSRLKPA